MTTDTESATERTGSWTADPRVQGMHDMRRNGATLKEIGDTYSLTRERVRQILASNGAASRDDAAQARTERKARGHAADQAAVLLHLVSHPGHTAQQVADATSIDLACISMLARSAGCHALLGDAFVGERGSEREFTPDDIIAWLRRAASDVGGPYLSTIAYRRWRQRTSGAPSVALIHMRFDSWTAACAAAGVSAGAPRRAAYTLTYTDQDLIDAVAQFLASGPTSSSAGQYEAWRAARTTPTPSLALVRQRTGSWNTARTLALKTMTGEHA